MRRAVAINPRLAQAQGNLGQYLLDLGRTDQASPHCREAVALQPGIPETHNNLGNVHRLAGRLAEAKACYIEALRQSPGLAAPRQPGTDPAAGGAD